MSTNTETGRSEGTGLTKGTGWLAALVGLWVLVTPFFLGGGNAGFDWLFWSNVVSGVVIAVLAGYGATTTGTARRSATGLAALVGLWVLVTPFFLGGSNAGFDWLFWSNIVSGVVVAVLAGYTAQAGQSGNSPSATA